MDDERLRRWALELAVSTFGHSPAPVDLVSAAAAFADFIRPAAPLLVANKERAARGSVPKSPDAAMIYAKGGVSNVARALGLSAAYVSGWMVKGIPPGWRPRAVALPAQAPFDHSAHMRSMRALRQPDAQAPAPEALPDVPAPAAESPTKQWSPARLAKLQEMLSADRSWDDITVALNLLPGPRIDSIAAAQLIASSHRFRRPTKPHRPAVPGDGGFEVEHTAHA